MNNNVKLRARVKNSYKDKIVEVKSIHFNKKFDKQFVILNEFYVINCNTPIQITDKFRLDEVDLIWENPLE